MKRVIRNCETCGAQLADYSAKRKIVCQYCGSIYIHDEFVQSEEDSAHLYSQTISDNRNQVEIEREKSHANATKARKIIPLIVLIAIASSVILILNIFSQPSRKMPKAAKTPEMLPQLPTSIYAGTSIHYSNWELKVAPEIKVHNRNIFINLTLMNW